MPAEPVTFESNASTQPLPEVVEAVPAAMRDAYGNPSNLRGRGANVYLDPCLIKTMRRAAVDLRPAPSWFPRRLGHG